MRNARTWQFAGNEGPDQPARMLTESMDTVVHVDEQRMSRSDCMDAHAHQGLCCWHIHKSFLYPRCLSVIHFLKCSSSDSDSESDPELKAPPEPKMKKKKRKSKKQRDKEQQERKGGSGGSDKKEERKLSVSDLSNKVCIL